ncbi:hypothetical protein LR48_Vigan02g162500 [Vigna angularis]|uniref:Uncharacterized protein n=2 Tax=Phaseolus angularis TaxID=3914 RepID=A0A0L9TY69_PHAAN|nr:uncharacterized protein HKW66_Vig0235720 [Vigna angularis]KOM35475.1 hypothetical protein LR48_Vigan02g162500 [Vigna angularis]BAT95110.1 hypothetical protein VIGAN_08177400 [Vigna angularis var. angularis]
MAVMKQPPVRTDIQAQAKVVRIIDENQIRIARRERKRSSPPLKPEWNDHEAKRKRRVAKYKRYETEGKVKSSLNEGFRTFKIACIKVVATLV